MIGGVFFRSTSPSDRVVDIDKTMPDTELIGQPFSQCAHPVTLGCMMSRSKIVDTALARHVYCLLGDLATDEGIQPLLHGRLDIGLRSTGTPANPAYLLARAGNVLWRQSKSHLQVPCQRRCVQRLCQFTVLSELQTAVVAKVALWRDAKQ